MPETAAVVRIHLNSLTDDEGIYGLRMERLVTVPFKDITKESQEVHEMVKTLHARGYCHGDLSPCNVMLNEAESVMLIDLAFSGRIGERAPGLFPAWAKYCEVFGKGLDEDRLRDDLPSEL